MSNLSKAGFEALFRPAGVAVFGSAAPGKLANVLAHRLLDGGMDRLYAINPKALPIENIPGYPSAASVGKRIDLAVIASPAQTVPSVLLDCAAAGVKAAIIISSGFSEAGNAAGEEEVRRIAAENGIAYIGPNCAGLVNTHSRLVATLEACPKPGSVALISQSGAVGGAFMAMAESQGVGVSKFVSYGNGSGLKITDFLDYLSDDEETSVIAMYLETVTDGRGFMKLLSKAAAKKPVVIIKSGRTSSGQRAALSHTGSMAGSDKVFDAAIKQCGAIRVQTLEEMFDLCKGFATGKSLAGGRLAIITNSGGPGVMSSDRAEECGLAACEPDKALSAELSGFLPPHAGLKNPIDLTVEGTGEQYEQALTAMLSGYDAAIALYIGTPYLKAMPVAKAIVAAAKSCAKPVFSVLQVGADIEESIEYLRENGVPNYISGERATQALAKMRAYGQHRDSRSPNAGEPAAAGAADPGGKGYVLEPEAMELLRKGGIATPPFAFAKTAEEAAKEAAKIGFPVVMKVVSPQILHKSDCGGVELGVASEAQAQDAFGRIQSAAEGKDFKGVVIYPMLKGGREVILGLTRDKSFGPVIAFGLGGIYTEVLKDVVFRVAPISRSEALEMIACIRSYPILRGVRGQAPADTGALADAITAFSQLSFLYPDIAEADLNPVFVFEQGLAAADARIVISGNNG